MGIVVFKIILGIFLIFSAEAQEKPQVKSQVKSQDEVQEEKLDDIARSKEEPRISNKWFRGNYLIYDCDDQHFACVNEISYLRCENQRNERTEEREPKLGCAPLKKFKTQKECFKVQYQKQHNQIPKTFCLHPRLR